jgi:hypothetical protein
MSKARKADDTTNPGGTSLAEMPKGLKARRAERMSREEADAIRAAAPTRERYQLDESKLTPGPVERNNPPRPRDNGAALPGRSVVGENSEAAAKEAAASTKKSLAPSGGPVVDLTTPEGQERARAEIRRIAGNVGLRFGAENHYDWEGHVVTLAARRDVPIGVAFHEALHAVFKAIAPEDKATLYRALASPAVKARVVALLEGERSREAIDALNRDSEELAAYAFQFHKLGLLELNPAGRNWIGKIQQLMEKAWAWVKDQPTAQQLLERIADGYYKDGGPDPVSLALLRQQRTANAAREVLAMATRGVDRLRDKLLTSIDDRLRETGVGEIHEIARDLYAQVGEESQRRGFAQAVPQMSKKWMNEFGRIVQGDPAAALTALRAIAAGDETASMAADLRRFLDRMHQYLTAAGDNVGYVEKYLPMQWSGDKIRANRAAFLALMHRHAADLAAIHPDLTPEKVTQMMASRNLTAALPTGDVYDDHGVPTAHHLEQRVFGFLSNAERAQFSEDDLVASTNQYIKQAVKRAEYVRRFGNENEKLEAKLEAARARGATDEQIALVRDAIDAVTGAKFARMDPNLRKVFGAVQTYQNLRVLPLALFGSIIDPLVLAVRTGEFQEAWGAYKHAITSLLGSRDMGELQRLAEDVGAVESAAAQDAVMGLYGGFELEGNLKKANDLYFTYNGMNGLTRALRVYATGAGVRFLQKHANNERMLRELGLEKADVANGVDTRDAKIQAALGRFVDESVLHPNSQERPAWGNDPMWGLVFHLKQYVFSFHKVVTKKVVHEMHMQKSLQPGLAVLPFIAISAASGLSKDLIQHAGSLPAGNGFMHYLGVGVSRSGFLGPDQLEAEATSSFMHPNRSIVGALGGPTLDQLMDATQLIAQPHKMGSFLEEALPGSALFKHW